MNTPKKLLMIIADLAGGGTERVFAQLIKALPGDRFDIQVCLWRRRLVYEIPDSIPLHIFEKSKPWHAFRVISRTRQLVESWQPDIVFSALAYTNILTGAALAQSRVHPRWVCRLGGDPAREFRGPMRLIGGLSLRRASLVIGNSDGVCQMAMRRLGLRKNRVKTLYNPLDIQAILKMAEAPLPFARPTGRWIIVHAGRFETCKNQALLLRSFAHLKNRPVELWMLGRGSLEKSLRALAKKLGISDRVRWLGFQNNPFMFYRQANCFVLSSNSEGLPNALIEAMACGTASVATKCPYGPEELIENGKTGMLLPMGDEPAMAAALEGLMNDSRRCAELGKAAARFIAKRFDFDACIHEHVKALTGEGGGDVSECGSMGVSA